MSNDEKQISNSKIQEYKSSYWDVKFIPDFISSNDSTTLFNETEHLFDINNKIQKRRSNMTLGERDGMTYKVSFGYGSNEKEVIRKTLSYSKISSLKPIKDRIETYLEKSFPMCAILRYPNGSYGIKRHRDREVPARSIIVGLSVGETRTLVISSPKNNIDPLRLNLTPGSLYIFYPPTNERAFHCIEEDSTKKNCRISFTFRTNWTAE